MATSDIELSSTSKFAILDGEESVPDSDDQPPRITSHSPRQKRSCVVLAITALLGLGAIAYAVFFSEGISLVKYNREEEGIICDFEKYSDWIKSVVTIEDGEKYTVVDRISHDPSSFTQGLTYANGVLYESTGLYGNSKVRILDPASASGDVLKSYDMKKEMFGEGMTYWKGKLVQITWKSKKGFIYNASTLEAISPFEFKTTNGQGWGITWDWCRDEFIVTDGTNFLHFWDTNTLQQKRKVEVYRMSGKKAKELNEIEYWRGRVLANVWFEDVILVIDPTTGKVEKEYDFRKLWPKEERNHHKADVLNGISISEDDDILYITGKLWDRIYSVRLNV
eukprot:scaffold22599_cov139-Cylindrotheca_fusiformis.AAC.2